jgi:hypothetical protein
MSVVESAARWKNLIFLFVNAAVLVYNGNDWLKGDASGLTIAFTILPGLAILILIVLLIRPPHLKIADGAFSMRFGLGLKLSTPAANVDLLSFESGKVQVLFKDPRKVTASDQIRKFMDQTHAKKGVHLLVPMDLTSEQVDRVKSALPAQPTSS